MNKPLVYFVQCNEYVKIGRSTQLPLTLRSLQRGNPYGLEAVAVISCESTERMSELEADLHRQFKEHRIRGEWFFLCPEIETYIKTHGQDPMPYLDDTEYLERKRRYNADPEYRKKQRKYYSEYKKGVCKKTPNTARNSVSIIVNVAKTPNTKRNSVSMIASVVKTPNTVRSSESTIVSMKKGVCKKTPNTARKNGRENVSTIRKDVSTVRKKPNLPRIN